MIIELRFHYRRSENNIRFRVFGTSVYVRGGLRVNGRHRARERQ